MKVFSQVKSSLNLKNLLEGTETDLMEPKTKLADNTGISVIV